MLALVRPSAGYRSCWLLGLTVVTALAGLAVTSDAHAAAHRVYIQTNAPGGNELVVFSRTTAGSLTERGRVSTGGTGATPSMETPITDSAGSVSLSSNGKLLFVTNAGSNTISSFRLASGRMPQLVDQQSTGGQFPLSADSRPTTGGGGLLYTVNYISGDISGFRYSASGKLTSIPNSLAPLSTTGAGARPAAIRFVGSTLVVSLRNTNDIDTFRVNADGSHGPAVPNPTTGKGPFGFALDKHGHVLVNDGLSRSTSSYSLGSDGKLKHISTGGPTGKAPCWVSVTPNGRYAISSDGYGFGPAPVDSPPMNPTGPGTITSFALSKSGKLTYLGNVIAFNPGLATDSGISLNGKYFDVIKPNVFTGMTSVETYTVRPSGGVIYRSRTPETLPVFSSGMVESRL